MVWPLVAMAAVSIVSAAYAEHKKGEISREELEKRKALAKRLEDGLKAPDGVAEKFTPEEYAQIQKYSPEVATFVQEKRPQLLTEGASQTEKQRQRDALSKYSNLAETGVDRIADAQREEALFEADAREKSRRASILRDMSNRGLSGSGTDILAQMQGSQDAQVNARAASLDATKQAEARRLAALGSMAGLAGQIRNQNTDVEKVNTDIMNSFNQRLSSAQNLYNQYAANTRNQGQLTNINNAARVNMANTDLRNNANLGNITRQEQATRELRNFENDKLRDITNAQGGLAATQGAADRDRVAGNNATIQSGTSAVGQVYSGMKADEQAQQKATLEQQRYDDEKAERQKDRDANILAGNRIK